MKKMQLFCMLLLLTMKGFGQGYFPPLSGNTWDTISPYALGWDVNRIDNLYHFLDTNHTKAFIILKDGKIAIEKYFGLFTADSAWQWNSAGKSLTAFLVGVAQQQGLLSINDTTSAYLGTGWTACPPEKEKLITIRHQLTMTTGLDYKVPDDDCILSSCLSYKADAGSFWYYYNAPYRLLQDVVAHASGKSYQQYTSQQLSLKTGITGLWYNYTFYSRPRSMARFGLLMLNKGTWSIDTILQDTAYYQAMINTSQPFNQSYGYLWWLNGKDSYKIPGTIVTLNGDLCPPAPREMYAALGKDDQKLYVWPSQRIVVVRMGEATNASSPVPIEFDSLLWKEMNLVFAGPPTGLQVSAETDQGILLYPNPASDRLFFRSPAFQGKISAAVHDVTGKVVQEKEFGPPYDNQECSFDIQSLYTGIYLVRINTSDKVFVRKVSIVK